MAAGTKDDPWRLTTAPGTTYGSSFPELLGSLTTDADPLSKYDAIIVGGAMVDLATWAGWPRVILHESGRKNLPPGRDG